MMKKLLLVLLLFTSMPAGAQVFDSSGRQLVGVAQDIRVSPINSTTTNLAAAASFTGTSASTLGVGTIQINFFADQNATIQVQQAQESPGVNWNIVDTWTYTASSTGAEAARSIQATASTVRVIVTNNGGATTTALRLQTILCPVCDTMPRGTTQLGNLKVSVNEVATTAAGLGKAEDAAHASGDVGVAVWGVRKDTTTGLTTADGEYVPLAADNYGALSTSLRHPNAIRCTITSTATVATLITGCAAPGAGLSIYVTSVEWSSSIISTTANFMRLVMGTGGACGTGQVVLYDSYASIAFGGRDFTLGTPWKLLANNELCFVHAAAGTRLVNITGFIAP